MPGDPSSGPALRPPHGRIAREMIQARALQFAVLTRQAPLPSERSDEVGTNLKPQKAGRNAQARR